jgi:hypothetical protein
MIARNIFEAVREADSCRYGDSADLAENFEPNPNSKYWVPTDAPAGSHEKKAVLRRRLTLGLPLWHPEDNPMLVSRP